jgi:multidrug resistance protein MdtO
MATVGQNISGASSSLSWFWQFLQEELTPSPGRAALVARMVVAATIVMIIIMTFRLPYGGFAALYALLISRESPKATLNAAKVIVAAFAFTVLYVAVAALMFLDYPILRLFWVIGTLFVMFYALRAMSNYTAAARFGYLLIILIPLWDEHISAGRRVEYTLWAFGSLTLASVITALTEFIFAEFSPQDELVQSIVDRLAVVEQLLGCYIAGRPVDNETAKHITRLTMVGMSKARQTLGRSAYAPGYAEQMGAVVALVGRLVDIAANLTHLTFAISDDDRERIRSLAANIAEIRHDLLNGRIPRRIAPDADISPALPLLREMAKTVSLIGEFSTGSQSLGAYTPFPAGSAEPRTTFFVRDALSNPEHVKFALKGCLAASLCYIIYNGKDWPGISTAITTCFLTALTTIGSSRQKQILRIAGAIVGGVVLGIGAQIFILPSLDSIAGFTLLFLAVTIPAAWVATSSPRLSYFGFQVALAFYLLNLSEFKAQTSLTIARDRVVGILLGLVMMWLVFDQLWGAPAVVEMKKAFISTLRLLAQFTREPLSKDPSVATERSYSLRETINKNFDSVRAFADGVALEFGPSRNRDLAWRSRIVRWQSQLRILFLTRIALWKYRAQLPGFELPEPVRAAQQEFDTRLGRTLDAMADRMDGKASVREDAQGDAFEGLEKTVRFCCSKEPEESLGPELQTFLALSRSIEEVTLSIDHEIHSDPQAVD